MSELEPIPPPTRRRLEGYKYTEREQAEKDYWIKQMLRDYPNTPGGELWCDWVYDFVKQTPQEELDRIMDQNLFDRPSKFSPENNKN